MTPEERDHFIYGEFERQSRAITLTRIWVVAGHALLGLLVLWGILR